MNIYRKAAAACAVAATIMAATPAFAQQPSAAAMTIAREIVDMKKAADLFAPVIVGVVERNKLNFLQTNPNLQRDLDAVAAQLRGEYASRQAEIKENIARIYAVRFTEAELKEVAAFYKSPIGKKMTDEEPKFVDDTMRFMDEWTSKLADEVMGRFRTEMKKKGHEI
jgi:hypothetical protein